jgi:AraC-like DNA-binding protein
MTLAYRSIYVRVIEPPRVNGIMNGLVTHEGHENPAHANQTIFDVPTATAPDRRSMKRAAQLFAIDEWGSDSDFVEKAWMTHSETEPAFISIATSHWHMAVTTQRDVTKLTLRGPETRATITSIPADTEFFGIVFTLGTFMPAASLDRLVNRAVTLPAASPNSVRLDGSRWEIPTPRNADVFVDRLVRQGVITRDPVVAEWFQDDVDAVSTRTLQRRVARATGLTRSTIRQIARAEKAVEALGKGVSPPDAALLLGYADQAHLIRSLKRFIGLTPTQVNRDGHWSIASPLEPDSSCDW